MIQLIIQDAFLAIIEYSPFAIITGGIMLTVVGILQSIHRKQTISRVFMSSPRRYLVIYLLCVYLCFVLAITVLSREPGSRAGVTLEVFGTFSSSIYTNIYPIENVLMLIPLGFLLPLLWSKFRRPLWCMSGGIILSLLIELIQYITKRGYVQTDDVLMNTLGTMLGFMVYYGYQVMLHYIRDLD
jgi:glycopeptide antibiotics resistance protein